MGTRPRLCSSRCVHCQLEQVGYNIRISAVQFDTEDIGKAGKGSSRGAAHRTTLAHSRVVSTDAKTADTETNLFTSGKESSSVGPLRCSSSPTQTASASGSLLIRKAVQAQGIRGRTCEIICASWRESTKRQYAVYFSRWNQCCASRNSDPFRPAVALVLDFLTELIDEELGYSAINTARSAVSAVTQTAIGSHPQITRFLKGVFELRPTLPKYTHTWDAGILLDYFRRQKTNVELSLKELSKKLAALLLIVSVQRVQTIHLLKVSCIQFPTTGCTIHVVDKLKHTRPGYHQKPLELPYFQADEKLCAVKCLEEYIKRTKDLGQNCDQLLLCHARPHSPASKDTVSRWLRDVLTDAEICDFTPHSFRGALALAMLNSGATLDDILKSARWTNASTFYKFYNRSVKKETKKLHTDQKSILKYFQGKQE